MTERCPYFVSGCRCGLHARHRGVCQVVEDWQPKRDSTPPATPVEPTCVACDKGDHQHCLGGVCACIHSRDWKRQDEEWSDMGRASTPTPGAPQ